MTAEDLLTNMIWEPDDLVTFTGLDVVGEEMKTEKPTDNKHLWTPTIWYGPYMGCYKLDLRAIKTVTGRLKMFYIWTKFTWGLRVFVHNIDQVFDKSLRSEVMLRPAKPHPKYYQYLMYDVSFEVIKTISTDKHPCSTEPFDQRLSAVAREKMMTEVGCVVPFVDQAEGAPICIEADAARKANEIYHKIFKILGLYEREDVFPPCEYFIPNIKETVNWRPQTDNYTVMASFEFSTKVHLVKQDIVHP